MAGDPVLAERVRQSLMATVPEIRRGRVAIAGISVSRRAGGRPLVKAAVRSNYPTQSHDDAKGVCIGTRGERAHRVAYDTGVRLDLVAWSADLARFVAAALAPARIQAVTVRAEPGGRMVLRAVAESMGQATLAIGASGAAAEAAVGLIRVAHPVGSAIRGLDILPTDQRPKRVPEAEFELE